MTSSKAYLPRLLPLADLVLIILCAYYAPWITNAVAPLLGWQQGPCFDVFTTTFIAGIAVAAAHTSSSAFPGVGNGSPCCGRP